MHGVALVQAASTLTGIPVQDLLEAFGAALVPGLLRVYGSMVKKSWRTLDLVEHTEGVMHTVVRRRMPGADPPPLSCARPSPSEVVVTYTSGRRLRSLARGIIRGIKPRMTGLTRPSIA
jgi:hypothetical protein